MTLKELQNEMNAALKAGQKERRSVLATLVASCWNAAITPKGRVEVTEDIVNATLLKEVKIVKEQIDTCPASRADLLESYKAKLAIIEEFAPKMITNETEVEYMIKNIVLTHDIDMTPAAKKIVMPKLKAMNVDMKVANAVFAKLANAK